MATINHIVLPDGTSYEIEDTVARAGGGGGGGGSVVDIQTLSQTKDYTSTSERVTLSSGTTSTTVLSVTSPLTGYVFVSGGVQFTASSSNNRHVSVTIGSNTVFEETQVGVGTNSTWLGVSGVGAVTSGSTVAIKAWQNSGSTLYAGGKLYAVFISATTLANGDNIGYGGQT